MIAVNAMFITFFLMQNFKILTHTHHTWQNIVLKNAYLVRLMINLPEELSSQYISTFSLTFSCDNSSALLRISFQNRVTTAINEHWLSQQLYIPLIIKVIININQNYIDFENCKAGIFGVNFIFTIFASSIWLQSQQNMTRQHRLYWQ